MVSSWEDAEWIYFGIPMDFTVSFQPGSRFAPVRVREASYAIETYSVMLDRDLDELRLCDAGDLELPFGNVTESLHRIKTAVQTMIADGKRCFALGGEHLVSFPIVQALVEKYPDLVIVHLDAHADLRDDYLGEKLSHATVMRRISERIRPGNLYQFGIRSGTRDEIAFARQLGHFYPHEVKNPLEQVLGELQGRPVYVTIDSDVIDPAYLPGTGTPEPGGISSTEAFEAVRLFKGLQVVGADLVEVMPANDVSQRSAVLAAKLIREALLAIA
ncbi:MAG: agmatinase [Sulfobacillus benefaciens]|jgi:agmatinase|uniref:Agmatinase n=1 Tax=Sulfobacillus benefaciens TaxID=453960 RepID=A0A2T2WYW8_9FIRM|nr:MAG: agmatinase [Sulfobacillus benefaciens]HBQ96185.1 agmatinase [Sulfobacillus sp.]